MGPRPRGRGIGGTAKALAEFNHLQWGRDRAVAELGAKGAQGLAAAQPSMGPRPRGRGIAKSPEAARLPSFLQWGRDRAVAEFRHESPEHLQVVAPSMGPRPRGRGIPTAPPSKRLIPKAFNGAATARSRNSGRVAGNISRLLPLQWGRDRAVAELLAAGIPWRAPTPSMGPRPRGRGISAPSTFTTRGFPFNGAATARSRNCRVPCLGSLRGRAPSMGPRPRGRGIAVVPVSVVLPSDLQWGRDRAVAEF